ncbi:NitT/TauT family transport system substrate-binding protein [Azospirillum brasilense]|uniref:NitT/TauT family transport system substrate-binding protein n=1 Tax=Azospirillum brasilense TaxID=192 RepID=A0A560CRL7_AZOBR|nr:ABC transporter substrate-binding protein [Azospirillum brasilense]TWA87469.1 NitT/TauT family transport system substrate-binding protein [Azospirillum brasilense]
MTADAKRIGSTARRAFLGLTLAAGVALVPAGGARAEATDLTIAIQYGLGYLPLMIAKNQGLIEKHAEAQGIGPVKVNWLVLNGGVAANDALLSGSAQIVSAGIAPLLTVWDKTRGGLGVKAISGLDSSAYWINSNNPNVRSIRDLTDKDRIAVPAVKVSINSVILQIAAEKEFGPGHQYDFEPLTTTLSPPDATAALVSGKTEITGHITTPTYGSQQLAYPNVHRILNSRDVIGEATLVLSYTTQKFYDENPKLTAAVVKAMGDGFALIKRDKAEAARIYLAEERSKLTRDEVVALLDNPDISYSQIPQNTGVIADYMHRVGSIKTKPASWKDYTLPILHNETGS